MKKHLILFAFTCILSSFLIPVFSQTDKWPKTLLWRISGKDLKKPSFLYGTMHLQDKRVFNLTDSFYHYFEKAEGFAIEVDFNEFLDSVLTMAFASVENEQLNEATDEGVKDEVKIGVADSAELLLPPPREAPPGVEMSKPSKKYLRKLRNDQIRRLLVYGEMPTILDAYIYGMAMKQGKWLGAVEDVKDQLNLRDELGMDLDDTNFKKPADTVMLSIEKMIKIYIDQNLNDIENFALKSGTSGFTTKVFYNRNIKMANSMDSLSHQRSMFYAVGAAHLPGDSGVIKLLRQKGYTVEPVISKIKIAAEKYAENLPDLAWYEINNEDKLYSIEMPGIPKEYNMFGEMVKMRVFVDITNLTFYMTGHTIAQYDNSKLEDVFKEMGKSMSKGGKMENIKKIKIDGSAAVEGTIYGNGFYYKVQLVQNNNTLFILMLGSQKKPAILSASANKYFNSFKPGIGTKTDVVKNWKEFSLADKGFKILLPAVPKPNKAFEKQAQGTGWKFTVYDCTDLSAGLYYLVQVRDIEAGKYIDGDSAYFQMFKANLEPSLREIYADEISSFNGFPSYRFDGLGKEDDIFYKTKNIVRGNRVYSLMVIGQQARKDHPGADQFFNSFQMTDYEKPEPKLYAAPDNSFTGWATNKFVLMKDEEGEKDSTRVYYNTHDEKEVVSYEIIKNFMPAGYWAENDSVFYESRTVTYQQYTDSILSRKKIRNGNLQGFETIIQPRKSNNLKRIRMFLHGDTLYTLIAVIASQNMDNPNHTKFFNEFKVKNDNIQTTVFTDKSAALFETLQTKDSARFEQAFSMLDKVKFSKKNLPVLHNALLNSYKDDSLDYYSVRTKLVNAIEEIADNSTVDFVKNNYEKLSGDKEYNKVSLLNVLANYQTDYSYALLKDLLVNHLPKQTVHTGGISYSAGDSLLLTKTLFPEILTLSRDPFMWKDVAGFAANLIDSGMISIDMLRPYEKDFMYHVDTFITNSVYDKDNLSGWQFTDHAHLLGKMNTSGSNALLQKATLFADMDLKQEAVLRLLENNQPVNAKEIEKLAAENNYRLGLFEELKKMNKQSFFPAKYLTQRHFAEAELYSVSYDDYEPTSVEFIGEREIVFDGAKQRFFLFRFEFSYDEEDEKEEFLGMAGPFSLDTKKIETNNDATGLYYEEQFDRKKINKHVDELMKTFTESVNKRKAVNIIFN